MRGSITGTGLIALALTFACARRSPEAAAVPDRPALRVERLAPRVGGGLDSATVLSAHIWYYIPAPDFEPGRYSILVVFQSDLDRTDSTHRCGRILVSPVPHPR
jgi:hypothetical protein